MTTTYSDVLYALDVPTDPTIEKVADVERWDKAVEDRFDAANALRSGPPGAGRGPVAR